MARTIGYRLEGGLAHGLTWLLTQAAQVVSGLAAQCYATSSAGTAPERLLLQERLVESSGPDIRREARLLAAARLMVEADRAGAWHWGVLKLAYGPMRRGDPHGEFGREQGALARLCPAVLARATEDWAEWHCRRREDQVTEARGESGGRGSEDRKKRAGSLRKYIRVWNESRLERDFLRIWRVLPDEPPPAELGEVVDRSLDGLCARLWEAKRMSQPERPEDARLARDVHAETDAMLADASLAFARAYRLATNEEENFPSKLRRRDAEEAQRVREEGRELAERVLRSLRQGEAA